MIWHICFRLSSVLGVRCSEEMRVEYRIAGTVTLIVYQRRHGLHGVKVQ